ncbi:MAG TPA: gluconolaconase [Flavobacterium sp.]|jgi:DNA-binding beta-propeller fold protein YncE
MKKILLLCFACAGCIRIEPTQRITFDAPAVYPEGIAYNPAQDMFYVSSATKGTVGRVTAQGLYSSLYSDNTLKSTYGMKMHPDGQHLFVCVGDANYSLLSTPETKYKMARLISIDVTTGKKLTDVDLAGLYPGKHFPNDIAFDQSANLYMTDSYSNVIYKIAPDGRAAVFADSPMFKTQGIGLNGIVVHPDGYLLTVSSATGNLYKVNINNPTDVRKVALEQFFLNGDGLLLNDNNNLTLLQNGGTDKIFNLTTEDNWQSAKMTKSTLVADRFTYPATATMAKNDIWVMNARFHDLEDSTSIPSKKFAIQKVVFKPLPRPKKK